jgi:hypothetical protein
MSVYVDDAQWPWRGKMWAHLMADNIEELHDFAKKLGLQRSWFQSKAQHAHYDITANKRFLALKMGAIYVNSDTPENREFYRKVIQKARAMGKELKQQKTLPFKQ